jgi:hypothetical protein
VSTHTVQTKTDRSRWAILIALCLFSAFAGRFCFLARRFDNDAAIFIYMGKMVSEGGRLCHDLIDNKFPTVGLMTSILWRTFGTTWFAYIALQTTLSLAGGWILGGMAKRHIGPHAFWPTTLFAVVYMNFTTAVFGGFQLETVQAFFAILAARSALRAMDGDNPADMFVAGLCAGCGAMCKPTGLAVLGAAVAGLITTTFFNSPGRNAGDRSGNADNSQSDPRPLGLGCQMLLHLFAMCAGVAIPLGCALLYLIQADLLRDMPALYRQISTYASQTAWAAEDLTKPLVAIVFLGFPMFVRGVISRRQRDAETNWPARPVVIFALAWLAAETAGVVMQRRMYAYHFLPIVPPAALVFGLFPRRCRPLPLAAAIVPMAFLSIYAAGEVFSLTYTGQDRLPATEYLAAHAKPGDAVWIDSWPRLVLETNLRPGSRWPFTFLFANYDNAGLDYAAGMIDDFERIKPAYIFLPEPLDRRVQCQLDFIAELMRRPVRRRNYAEGWRMIEAYTLAHYDRATVVGGEVVYHRRADGGALTRAD